mmetsp:Transcript_7857/g.10298  ORF Transcript_7857/g.10298 Transcript_7857/m.10298 type:complete len:300 (+) Transcript_7857:259-1158(+)|eukprot:CAMPEP_0198147172 /NCGR_PEP_ID=MMETSP1443-20131203/33568_1 /TAXON_ID=186043 /ORGANISM="Entomoneis sp., Strain CCMP2396" /LENGTH=299 /DNA_ID=CAMNT_0043811361 /DNA_START=201 /DNA_END=1100 /DNA_ORIENTATION=-
MVHAVGSIVNEKINFASSPLDSLNLLDDDMRQSLEPTFSVGHEKILSKQQKGPRTPRDDDLFTSSNGMPNFTAALLVVALGCEIIRRRFNREKDRTNTLPATYFDCRMSLHDITFRATTKFQLLLNPNQFPNQIDEGSSEKRSDCWYDCESHDLESAWQLTPVSSGKLRKRLISSEGIVCTSSEDEMELVFERFQGLSWEEKSIEPETTATVSLVTHSSREIPLAIESSDSSRNSGSDAYSDRSSSDDGNTSSRDDDEQEYWYDARDQNELARLAARLEPFQYELTASNSLEELNPDRI